MKFLILLVIFFIAPCYAKDKITIIYDRESSVAPSVAKKVVLTYFSVTDANPKSGVVYVEYLNDDWRKNCHEKGYASQSSEKFCFAKYLVSQDDKRNHMVSKHFVVEACENNNCKYEIDPIDYLTEY